MSTKASGMLSGQLEQNGGDAKTSELTVIPPDIALARLIEGNQRWVSGNPIHPRLGVDRRKELGVSRQHPMVAVLGCSDSRNSPEFIFDQGLGDIFVIREAGNLADEGAVASIEYAVKHLGVRLVVILGHTRCGAIMAALDHTYDAHMAPLLEPIKKKIEDSRRLPGDHGTNASKVNAYFVAESLKVSGGILPPLLKSNELKILPALYNMVTGEVEFMHLSPFN